MDFWSKKHSNALEQVLLQGDGRAVSPKWNISLNPSPPPSKGHLSPRVHQNFNFLRVSPMMPFYVLLNRTMQLTSKIICNNSPLKASLNIELSN